jgi:hypothetical protein
MIATCSPRNFDHRSPARYSAHFHYFNKRINNVVAIDSAVSRHLESRRRDRVLVSHTILRARWNKAFAKIHFRFDIACGQADVPIVRSGCRQLKNVTRRCRTVVGKTRENRRRHRAYVHSPFVRAAIVSRRIMRVLFNSMLPRQWCTTVTFPGARLVIRQWRITADVPAERCAARFDHEVTCLPLCENAKMLSARDTSSSSSESYRHDIQSQWRDFHFCIAARKDLTLTRQNL